MEKKLDVLIDFLKKNRAEFVLEEHEPIRTAEEASRVRNIDIRHGVKALVAKIEYAGRSDFVLVLISGDRKMDPKKLCTVLKAKRAYMAGPDEVKERTGCEVGSVHPFGHLFGLAIFMDKEIEKRDFVSFSAGTHVHSVRMNTADFVRLVNPRIEDISKEK